MMLVHFSLRTERLFANGAELGLNPLFGSSLQFNPRHILDIRGSFMGQVPAWIRTGSLTNTDLPKILFYNWSELEVCTCVQVGHFLSPDYDFISI